MACVWSANAGDATGFNTFTSSSDKAGCVKVSEKVMIKHMIDKKFICMVSVSNNQAK
jgi:hypothetical protein